MNLIKCKLSQCFICGYPNDEQSVHGREKGKTSLIETSKLRNDGYAEILKSVRMEVLLNSGG